MKDELEKKAEVFKMLSNPVRLCILLNLIKNGTKNVSELSVCSCVSQSLMSQQLAKLKLAKVISCNKQKNEVYYEIVDRDVEEIIKKVFNI